MILEYFIIILFLFFLKTVSKMDDGLFVSLDRLLLEFGMYKMKTKKQVTICIIIIWYFNNEVKSQKNYLF